MAEPIHLHKPGELPVLTHSPSQAQAMQAAGWRVVSAAQASELRQFDAEAKRLAKEESARLEAERQAEEEAAINATVAFMEPDATAIELDPETDGPTTASADDGGDNRRRSSKPSKPAK